MEDVKVEVVEQGAPSVHSGYVYRKGDDVIAIWINMESKNCKIDAIGNNISIPKIIIRADDESKSLRSDKSRDDLTIITLPEFGDWMIWSAEIHKYMLTVCLVRH